MKLLLRHGAEVNARTEGGATALHRAAYQGHVGVVQTLLQAGADPAIQECCWEPLGTNYIEMDLVLQDDQGKTSAHKALEKKAEKGKEILELILLKHPKCGEILDHKGKSPTDS